MQSKLSCLQRAVAIAISVMLMSMGTSTLAQNATGAIKGTVKDQNDAVVTSATITATNKATGASRKLKAGSEGNFVFENLLPGAYEVKAEADGFKTQTQTVSVEVGNTRVSDFSMDVGTTSEVVDVTLDAPIINTTDTVVGGVINRERVEHLPLNGRSFLSIALLEPGVNVTYNANSGAENPNNFFQISVGSAPQQMTLISVDGARVNDRITGGTSQNFFAEMVQEFQISTLGFDLSSGTVSAGAVNIVSRTGGNEFHGSGFFFYRDHNLSAFPGFKRPDDPTAFNPLCADPARFPDRRKGQLLRSTFNRGGAESPLAAPLRRWLQIRKLYGIEDDHLLLVLSHSPFVFRRGERMKTKATIKINELMEGG